ncbi:MAG TPA: hypothetical protein VHQ47_16335 [Phycisphaerae bacterium]|nr:hypothetical protein [Phycisphaerae bacterium]
MTFEDPVLGYEPPEGYESAPKLVRLAGTFNIIVAVLDILSALGLGTMIVLLATGIVPEAMLDSEPGMALGGSRPPLALFLVTWGCCAALEIAVAVVKLVGATKLLHTSRNAWGWGLATGIVGCGQFWCGLTCVLPMAAGIYTIVILCREDVRRYLRDAAMME